MNPIIESERLLLIQLTDTSEGSQHVQWFHENWTDKDATSWSLHGPCKDLDDSRNWMIEHRTKWDNLFFSCFAKTATSKGTIEDPGEHVGSVSLRLQIAGPALDPPASFDAPADEQGTEASSIPLNLRVIGYSFFNNARGKGYATEANKALIADYARSVAQEKAKGEERFYIEGAVDRKNPGSIKVLEKLGFQKVGWKEEKEPLFLNGEWQDPGYWVYGLYV